MNVNSLTNIQPLHWNPTGWIHFYKDIDAATYTKDGLAQVLGEVRLYLDGGIIPMPKTLIPEFGEGQFVQSNPATPISPVSSQNDVIFISGNRKMR